MKALLLTDYRRLELADLPVPELGDDDVLIRVAACGICGSDIHGYDGASGRRMPPLVMGHEAAGPVEAVGAQVTNVAPGDRVTFDSTVSCGQCEYCREGRVNLCNHRQVLGVSCPDYRRHGAFAEFVAVPARIVYRLPDSLPFEHAAMIEPISVAVHAVDQTPLADDGEIVVIGSGMIGLLVIQVLKHAGCEHIIAVDVDDGRLALAQKLGAGQILNAANLDVAAAILDATAGRGAGSAFEVVGSTPTIHTAINCVRKGGSVTLIGNISPQVEMPLQAVVTRELTLRGSCASSGEYAECIDLLASNRIDVRPLISATAPLEDGPQWFDRLYRREPGLMKVLLKPDLHI